MLEVEGLAYEDKEAAIRAKGKKDCWYLFEKLHYNNLCNSLQNSIKKSRSYGSKIIFVSSKAV
jgi:hypothetical protein